MAWLAVEKGGAELIFSSKPERIRYSWLGKLIGTYDDNSGIHELGVYLPKGSIEKLIGKTLTWKDGSIEIV